MTNAHASALRGRMIGALVMTGFGAWWVFAGMGSVGGLAVWIYLAVATIPAALAAIFKAPLYYATGVVMIAWTIICWIFHPSLYRTISIAIGCGLVLWITSLVLLVGAQDAASAVRHRETGAPGYVHVRGDAPPI